MANAQNPFDFQSFTQDHQLSTLISGVTDLLSEGADPALVQKIKDFKEKFKLPNAQGDTPEFAFNLATDTYEEVPEKVFKDGKDLKKVTFVQADRFFVSDGYNENAPQKWKEVACPSTVDIHQESAQLTFLDSEKKHVDWPQTLNNLNEMIKSKLYSEKMMKACLIRFINHYEPGQTEYLKDRTCNEIAKFLLSLDSRIDKTTFHKTRLHNSVRLPEETLSAAVNKVRNIVDKLYPLPTGATEHDSNSIANRYLINAIISFLRDDLAVPLLKRVQQDSAISRLLYYTEYLNMAMNAEVRGQIFPAGPLKYGRKLNFGANPIMMLNNIEVPNIHPCMNIPPKKNFLPNDLSNYFGHFTQAVDDYQTLVSSLGDGISQASGSTSEFQQSMLQLGPVPPQTVGQILDPSSMLQGSFQPGSKIPIRNAVQYKRYVKKADVPKNISLIDSPQGKYFVVNKEKIYVEEETPSEENELQNPTPRGESEKKDCFDSESKSSESPDTSDNVYEQLNVMSIALQKVLDMNKKDKKFSQYKNDNVKKDFNTQNRSDSRDRSQSNYKSDSNRQNMRPNSYDRGQYYQRNSDYRQNSRGNSPGRPSQDSRGRTEYRSYPNQNRSNTRSNSQSNRQSYNSQSQNNNQNYVRNESGNRQNQSSGNFQRNDYQNRGRSPSPYNRDRRDISRDRSRESKRFEQRAYNSYPKMKKGYNCSPGYNPIITKKCSKCSNPNTHHEFECRVYEEWNENTCTLCEKYHHFSKSCKEISRFPPKNADNNSVNVN